MSEKRLSAEEEELVRLVRNPGQNRTVCPFCSHSRRPQNRKDRCMSAKLDDAGIVYDCKHCGANGSIFMGERRVNNVVAMEKKPVVRKNPEEAPKLEDNHYKWLSEERGISKETADKYGLFKTEQFFPAAGEKQDAVAFPYFDADGQIVSAKMRSIQSKAFTCWQSPPSFFGIQNAPLVSGQFSTP